MLRRSIHRRSMPHGLLIAILAAAMLLGPAGCSLFVDSSQHIRIEASDPAARIFVDGQEVGTGSALVPMRRNRTHSVRAEAPDGGVAQGRIRKNISTTGILDIVGGFFFLVPFLGILGPGFWELDPNYVYLKLAPPQSPSKAPSTRESA